jgi:hypothetical protein
MSRAPAVWHSAESDLRKWSFLRRGKLLPDSSSCRSNREWSDLPADITTITMATITMAIGPTRSNNERQ